MTSDMASPLRLGGYSIGLEATDHPGYKQPRTGRKGNRGGPLAPTNRNLMLPRESDHHPGETIPT